MSKLLILDVDGVMTNGTKLYGTTGQVVGKMFADQDFTAIKMFQRAGWHVVWLSADQHINEKVAHDRKIEFYNSRRSDGTINKVIMYDTLRLQFGPEDVIYVGDDLLDLPVMQEIINDGGQAYCPSNSAPQVMKVATPLGRPGGAGCILELYAMLYPDDIEPPTH